MISRLLRRTLFALAAATPLAAPAAAADALRAEIAYVTRAAPPPIPLSLLEPVAEDLGVQGARLGLADNATTGSFLGHDYALKEVVIPEDGRLAETVKPVLAEGTRLIVADLKAPDLLALADLPAAREAIIINARARDDRLRNAACRDNVLHVMPSRAMRADALAQYLRRKRWDDWFLAVGQSEADARFAEAVRRAAKRYGAEIAIEKTWTFDPANRRDESGHVLVQQQVSSFTRVGDYDILVVADEANVFGAYLPHRTARPRPVAGTQGLVPITWSRVHEQWGGTQLQGRFEDQAGRYMTARDYANWLAVRAFGEAVTRTDSAAPRRLEAYIRSADFRLQGFKGLALTFRSWNGQLRQPILLAGPRMLVSVSPQPGFLHERTELDTLGYDRGDSACDLDS